MSNQTTLIEVPCPGTRDNFIRLTNEVTTPFGIGHPQNTGTCILFLDSLDANGQVVRDLQLEPGQGVDWYSPPAEAVTIGVVCHADCSGTGMLTYDLPSA